MHVIAEGLMVAQAAQSNVAISHKKQIASLHP